ncbi:MAG: hypothetical protein JW837_12935 [Sedimentisphaerales bacterium]|nr:hypothetical protein [Sedimentisphaerales bacterium]
MTINLDKKNIDIKAVAKKAIKDDKLLDELLNNLWAKKETIRYNSHKVLLEICEEQPEVLYGHWDYLVQFLDSDNTYHKLSAVILLASLTKADKQNKFEKIFNKFYGLLNDKSFITAAYVSQASGKIALSKPKLEPKITNRLLSIEKTHHQQERKDLAKAYIIEAFEEYYTQAKQKKKIAEFVEKQVNCASPKTKKAAKEFLKRINQPAQN